MKEVRTWGEGASSLWTLDPDTAHLNHGSYGATPTLVQQARRDWLRAIEESPEAFFRDEMRDRLAAVRSTVAEFLGVDDMALALTGNVTEAVEVVLRTVPISAGSNIVTSADGYEWVIQAAAQRAQEAAAEVRTIELPPPERDFDAEVTGRFLNVVDDETALVIVDQITSPTALRLPVEGLIDHLRGHVPVLVDAAHSPGSETDPVPPGADFWVGSLHKWTYAPRGASALVVGDRWRDRITPLVVSDGTAGPFPASFDYTGTRDYSALLTIPVALEFPKRALGLTWPAFTAMNVESLRRGVDHVKQRLAATPCGPVDLPMTTLQLPVAADAPRAQWVAETLRRHGVEVAASSHSGRLLVRLSAQPYVSQGDYQRLCDVMVERVIQQPRHPPIQAR